MPEGFDRLHQAQQTLFPDPVDVFEDKLADELGIQRPDGMSYRASRRNRAVTINEAAESRPTELVRAQAAIRIRRSKAR